MAYENPSLHLLRSRVSNIGDPVADCNHKAFQKIPTDLFLPQAPALQHLQSTCTEPAQSSLLSPEADSVTCCKVAGKVSKRW